MFKKNLRWISALLSLALFIQLLPLASLDGLFQHAYAAAETAETTETASSTSNAPQITDNSITAVIPDTFTDKTEGDVLGRFDLAEPTEDDARYFDIVTEYSLYSSLSETDAAFLCSYTGVADSDFVLMEQNGLSISESVSYKELAAAFGYELSAILSEAPTSDECRSLLAQISLYNNIIDPELDTALDSSLRSQIFQGYTCEQVLNAYGVSQVHGINSSALLSGGDNLSSFALSDTERTQISTFSSSLGLSSFAVADHVTQNNVSTSTIASSTAQVESAVAGILSQSYPAGSSTGSAGEAAVFPETISSPCAYSYDDSEHVLLNSGSLVYESVDYTLPGVNGLDLVIGRRYDSQSANTYTPTTRTDHYTVHVYFVDITAEAYYYVPGIGTGRWSYYDADFTLGPYATYAAAKEDRDRFTGTFTLEDYSDGADLIYESSAQIVPVPVDEVWYPVTGKEENTYLNDLYGLGLGWSFQFSSLRISGNTVTLHLSDGSVYEADWSASNPSHLKNYTLTDKVFERNITEFTVGNVCSYYRLTYQGGKREYFSSDGKLIGICDRYGNTISFEHSTQNGYPCIEITDTLERTIIISGTATDTGHMMTVALPDDTQICYEVTQSAQNSNILSLSAVTDPVGRTTSYGYTLQTAGFNTVYKNISGETNTFANLTTITHPTGAQTQYTYEVDKSNLGSSGLAEVYRLTSRADSCEDILSNQISYTYSNCDNTGYPSYSNPNSLPSSFTYTSTVTDALGTATTAVFDKAHQTVSTTVVNNGVTLQSVNYEYNQNKLPIKVTTRQYNSSGAYLENIEAKEYDAKGNVTAQWSTLAEGDTGSTEYKTTYTYDAAYGLPLTQTYKTNADTTVLIENTLDSTGKNIISTQVSVNGTVTRRTDYVYDTFGNVIGQKQYYDNMTDYALTEYSYENGAYLTLEKHSGILTADGTAAASTPGQSAGVIATAHTYDSLGRRISTTDGGGNVTAYTYDAAGNVTSVTNPDGTTVTYARDYAGNKVTVTDENGGQITYTYTPLGLEFETVDTLTGSVISRREYNALSRLVKLSDFVYGSVTQYAYDVLGRVTTETVYQGTSILTQAQYAYDDAAEDGLYQKITKTVVGDTNAPSVVTTQYTDKHGNVVKTGKMLGGVEYFDTSTYDYAGNVLTVLTAADEQKGLDYTATYVYNEANQVVKAYNAEGNYTANTYDALGRLVQAADYAGTPTVYTYDALGRLLTQTITIQTGVTASTKYDYDPAGNLIREYKPVNAVGSAAAWSKTEYNYDSCRRLTSVVQYDGSAVASVTRYTYDDAGNTLTVTTGLTSLTGTGGSTTAYTYDRFGNVLTTTDALGQTETNTYDALGRLDSKTDRSGVTTSYTYDALGRILTVTAGSDTLEYTYTKTGQVRSEQNGWQLTEYTYDALGRTVLVEEIRVDSLVPTYTVMLALNGGTLPSETSRQLTVQMGDRIELPIPTRTGYTFLGWYLDGVQVDADGFAPMKDCTLTAHWGDASLTAGHYKVIYHGNGGTVGGSGSTELAIVYRIGATVTLPTAEREACRLTGWVVDGIGGLYLPNTVFSNGLSTISGEVINLSASWIPLEPGPDFPLPEDPVRPPETTEMSIGGAEAVGMSIGGAETSSSDTGTNDSDQTLLYTKAYTYDLAGNRTSFTLEYGTATLQSVTYTYDNLNRLSTVSQSGTLQATYTYDVNGNRTRVTYPGGVAERYQYNKANWVTSLNNRRGSTVLSSFTYTYYASGSQKSETDQAGVVTAYTYDGLGRLTRESESGGLTVTYTYDANGNRTQMAVSGTASYTVAYAYDAGNRLTTEGKTLGATTTTTAYSYDGNGNLLCELAVNSGAAVNHTYNGFGQLVSTTTADTTIVYTYNAQGIRTARYIDGGVLTEYLQDDGNVVGEVEDSTVSATYLRGANLISCGANYYLYNAHGDVVGLVTPMGTVTKAYDYDAFGNEKTPDADDANPFRYCGEYYDTETGLYYLRARYYDPTVGRFTQADTHWNTANMIYGDNPQKINERQDALGLKTYSYAPQISAVMQSGNLYVYALGNPVQYSDYTGEFVISTLAFLVGAGILVFGTLGGIAGGQIADQVGATGWEKAAYVAGGTLIGGVGGAALGYWLAPAVISATGMAEITFLAAGGTVAVNTAETVATGQFHHVLSNPIMKALDEHPTLSGLFNRASSVVQALTPEAHQGYQRWHRSIDQAMVQWLTNPANQSATANQFWAKMYELYNTPDMIQRFGYGVLNYIIKEMMK